MLFASAASVKIPPFDLTQNSLSEEPYEPFVFFSPYLFILNKSPSTSDD